jgi:putative Holliday junction resolvase
MPVLNLDDLPSALPRKGALTGVDAGEKTLGVAFCDALWTVATPHSVIRRTKFTDDANALFALMDERGSKALVIGLPLNMDGTEGPRCQSCRALGRNLLRLRPDLLVAFQDERLSTAAVQRTMIQEADLSRGKRAAVVDRAAAAWILDSALDRLRGA